MALMQINIVPLGSASTSVGEFVAGVHKALEKEDFKWELTDMGTVVEGNAGELLELAARIHEVPFQKGVRRVVTQIVIDDRRDKEVVLGGKVASIRERLNIADG
ncbi:MAG: MTH1187 family thiamine-binding protein [Proteobacteria bacterium]|nr:MTH1187 family thiamine-binding protein [Pseudomonadota bacterium]MBU1739411.1 MTH1187 family thiamine-binding protein [Pseudomonadota bacterium]